MLNDKLAEEEYKRSFCDNGIRTTPRERLLKFVSDKTKKPISYWRKLKKRNLQGIYYN